MPRGGFAHHPSIDYQPSKIAAGITGGLYLLAGLSLFTRLIRARSWWGLCLPIAALSKLSAIVPRLLWPNSFFSNLLRILCAYWTGFVSQLGRALHSRTALHYRHTSRLSRLQLHTIWEIHCQLR
jgi:hypothetical protein